MTPLKAPLDSIHIQGAGRINGKLKNWVAVVINVANPEEDYAADIFIPLPQHSIPQHFLDLVALNIQCAIMNDNSVIIHCSAGLERSPLCVAWWMHKYYHYSLDEAYAELRQSYLNIMDRQSWISYASLEESLYHRSNEIEGNKTKRDGSTTGGSR